ncbi:GNAT family N-acetyltransferase [Adhaeribacter rhizoryzae]|uniref:GNAT family N-acetyltransferase n=1 Tax=Adhaeribacter rhizoryzae TaxID=2607907 RepID=A0A5M6DPJ5_9BACT|nr:GNAT family N-acetyltransferase [Adhaeribacter rhizoryzae]KAA5548110.1 GNAT family N-acetyltransferase [Adhaeribacter rhizoryzae]
MIKATYNDKDLVVDILTRSFESNQSVNYIVKQDKERLKRIKYLMDYSFEVCYLFGNVFLSSDKKACALVLYPDKKKTTFKTVLLDVKLILNTVGFQNIKKTLSRESLIKGIQPKEHMYYLWFIGVDPKFQQSGIGTSLLNDLIQDSNLKKRPIYLETSTLKNLPWYQKFGFQVYHEAYLGYKLFFLKR